MRALNYWDQFLSTGRIKDYLTYREEEAAGGSAGLVEGQPAAHAGMAAQAAVAAAPETTKNPGSSNKGEGRGEGSGQYYRDGIKNRACW